MVMLVALFSEQEESTPEMDNFCLGDTLTHVPWQVALSTWITRSHDARYINHVLSGCLYLNSLPRPDSFAKFPVKHILRLNSRLSSDQQLAVM